MKIWVAVSDKGDFVTSKEPEILEWMKKNAIDTCEVAAFYQDDLGDMTCVDKYEMLDNGVRYPPLDRSLGEEQ